MYTPGSQRAAWLTAAASLCLVLGACGSSDNDENLDAKAGSAPAQTKEVVAPSDPVSEPASDPTSDVAMIVPVAQDASPTRSRQDADFADGNSGGPDFWKVTGVDSDDRLNIRSSPSVSAALVASVTNATVLRNLGCRKVGQSRWCRVGSLVDDGVDGWVNARFLRESGPPTTRQEAAIRPGATPSQSSDVPELVQRASGEFEIRFSSGCTVLANRNGAVLNAGAVCSGAQRKRALASVKAYIREQGL